MLQVCQKQKVNIPTIKKTFSVRRKNHVLCVFHLLINCQTFPVQLYHFIFPLACTVYENGNKYL